MEITMARYPHPERVQALRERLEDVHDWVGVTLHLKRLPESSRKKFAVLRLEDVLVQDYAVFEPGDVLRSGQLGPLLATYDSIDALLDDGWIMD